VQTGNGKEKMFSQIKLTNPPVYEHYPIKYRPKDFCPDNI